MTAFHPRSLTTSLGVVGWSHLDPILLAALALEAPVLLVGEHGTAKSLLVERVATALGGEFRHYNASLLNYDDLVGIPVPNESGEGLRFVGTGGAVWGAHFVFFDEINRCRPDLQNKMFPLVHERRIAGTDLPDLRHRWAAMNPPPSVDGYDTGYLGTEPLDAALADRFWFVVRVPTWVDLSPAERHALVADEPAVADKGLDIHSLVERVRELLDLTSPDERAIVQRYAVVIADALRSAGVLISARRVRLLARAVLATVAAQDTLVGSTDGPERATQLGDIAELVLRNGLPQWCEAEPPAVATVVAAHVQAWQLALDERNDVKRRLLAEPDPVRRLRLGLDIDAPEDVLGTLVTSALAALPTRAERMSLAVVLSRCCATHALTPAAWSTISDLATRALRPASRTDQVAPGRRLEAWREASTRLVHLEDGDGLDALEYALINACGAELLAETPVSRLSELFRDQCSLFEVTA